MMPSHCLLWFRNDLRVYDNPALSTALRYERVSAVYFFEPEKFGRDQFGFDKTGPYRAKFLLETLSGLRQSLTPLNIPIHFYLARPSEILPEIIKAQKVTHLVLQEEWTSEEREAFHAVAKVIPETVTIQKVYGQFLFHPEDFFKVHSKKFPEIFTEFRKICEKSLAVRATVPSGKSNHPFIPSATNLPALNQLGVTAPGNDPRSAFPFHGGETAALNRLESYLWETNNLATYKETRNGLLGTEYSSKLSPWLANGSISPRTIYWEIKKYEAEVVRNESTYWLIFELIWRDFFKFISLVHGNKIFYPGGIKGRHYHWEQSAVHLKNWIDGKTDEAFVNANMLELKHTGWMSNRGRQNVASYWAKSLQQDWRVGAAYFESTLIDYDVHSNWGNWMYQSGVGNDPRDRKFNIGLQAERYDPEGEYRSLWLDN